MIRQLVTGLALALSLSATTIHAETAAETVSASDPFARAVPPGQPNSALFMGLANAADQATALTGAESSVCLDARSKTPTLSAPPTTIFPRATPSYSIVATTFPSIPVIPQWSLLWAWPTRLPMPTVIRNHRIAGFLISVQEWPAFLCRSCGAIPGSSSPRM